MEEKLFELIRRNMKSGNILDNVTDNLDLSNDLNMDSIDLIRLFTDIEETFDFEFEYELMMEKNLLIYGELKKYVAERVVNK